MAVEEDFIVLQKAANQHVKHGCPEVERPYFVRLSVTF